MRSWHDVMEVYLSFDVVYLSEARGLCKIFTVQEFPDRQGEQTGPRVPGVRVALGK